MLPRNLAPSNEVNPKTDRGNKNRRRRRENNKNEEEEEGKQQK